MYNMLGLYNAKVYEGDFMKIKLFKYVFLFLIAFLFLNYFNLDYSFSDFKEYTTILVGISGMVFTIMGIWIAFLFPNALNRIVDPKITTIDFSEALGDTKRLESIVFSVLKSCMALVGISIVFLLKVLFYKTIFYSLHMSIIKSLALSWIVVLSVLLFESVIHVAVSNINFLNDLHKKREDRELDEDM